jgi:DNA-binding MarR family transcriptional regulator
MPLLFIPAIQQITHRVGLSIAALPGLDVSQGEAHILAHLADHGESTIAELHRALAHKRSTLTSILDRLAGHRWIVRRVSETDRRSFAIALTPTGKVRARKVLRHLESIEREMENTLTREESRQFGELLARLADPHVGVV